MKLRLLILIGAVAAATAGCGVNEAVLTGHDFVDEAVGAMRVGLEEYHADELERATAARKQLVAAFVKDVAAAVGDEQRVAATTQQLLALLDQADQAAQAEQQRRQRLEGWLTQLRETNNDLREIGQWKLRWSRQIATYVQHLREKTNAVGSGN